MLKDIEIAARAAGWDEAAQGLVGFVKTALADLNNTQRIALELHKSAEIHREQERRLKRELAETREELAKVRHSYNQQHDVWEELYVKDGVRKLLELKERIGHVAPDGVPLVLKRYAIDRHNLRTLLDACTLSKEELDLMGECLQDSNSNQQSRILAEALERVQFALSEQHAVEANEEVSSFVAKIEHFAREAVKPPENGAVSSKEPVVLPGPIDIPKLKRESAAFMGLLEALGKLTAGASTFDDVRNAAHDAWLIATGKV